MGAKARARRRRRRRAGRVDGRPVFCYAQDPSYARRLARRAARRDDRARPAARRPRARPGRRLRRVRRARACRRASRRSAGYGRIFREHVRLSGVVPQISVITGASAGGGSYSPALTDFVVMTRARPRCSSPARPSCEEVMGEDVDAAALGGARVHERNGVAHYVERRPRRRAARARPARPTCRSTRARPGAAPAAGARPRDPGDVVPEERAPGLRRPRRRRARRRRRQPARDRTALGAQHRLRVRAPRGPLGRGHRQPAALDRRRDRRRVRAEGRALRAHLQHVQPAAAGARRHAGLHAGHEPGAARASSATARSCCTRSPRRACRS